MKKILLIALLALTASCATVKVGGTVDPVHKNVENDKNKLENYVAANEWMVEAFNSAKSVVQFVDKETGIVKGKYNLYYAPPRHVGYGIYTPLREANAIVTIRVRDNASDIKITSTNVPYVTQEGFSIPTLAGYNRKIQKLVNNFVEYMK